MRTVYTAEFGKQEILIEEGNLLPFVPMGGRVPLIVAAADVLDDGFVPFDLPFKDGLQGPFFDLLQSRYGVPTRSAAGVRELTRLAGTLAYACERDRSGVTSVVMLAASTRGLDRDKAQGCICNGTVLERLLNKAVELGDVVINVTEEGRKGHADRSRRALQCTPQLRALYEQTRENNRYYGMATGWLFVLNRTVVKDKHGDHVYEYHKWDNREVKELSRLQADVSIINQNAARDGVGCMWMGKFYPFSNRVTRYHMVFHKSIKLGGRMYALIQQLRSRQRLDVTFMVNGQEVSAYEEDFSAMHPTMAYHRAGVVPPTNLYDFVSCEGLTAEESRLAVKLIVNCALNCKEFRLGVAAAAMQFQAEEREVAHMERRASRAVCRFVHAIAPHVLAAHEAILGPSRLGENTGKELQRIDSDIARHVLRDLGIADVPCISVHDSFVVPITERDRLHRLMAEAYQHAVGHLPQTKAEWLEDGVKVEKRYPVPTGVVLEQVMVTAETVAKHAGK